MVRLSKVTERIQQLEVIYEKYREALSKIDYLKLIPVNVKDGEIPLYIEVLSKERGKMMKYLDSRGIQTRPLYPDLDSAVHLKCDYDFPNTRIFGKQGLVLPCGPDQPLENVDRVIDSLHYFRRLI